MMTEQNKMYTQEKANSSNPPHRMCRMSGFAMAHQLPQQPVVTEITRLYSKKF